MGFTNKEEFVDVSIIMKLSSLKAGHIFEYYLAGCDSMLINPDEVIINQDDIKITFDYPLSHKVTKEFSDDNGGGFTRHDIWQAVHDGYQEIYDEEDAAVCDPGIVGATLSGPICVNRAESNGPHGIWGHSMDDLYIEGVVEKVLGEYELIMGS